MMNRDLNRKKTKNIEKEIECFKPCHEEPDMRIVFDTATTDTYPREYKSNEVIYVQNLFKMKRIFMKDFLMK